MKKDYQNTARAINALLEDDSDLSVDDLKAELASQGVDVDGFLARFSSTVRKGCQAQIGRAAICSANELRGKRTNLFGDLGSKALAELIAIKNKVLSGEFGPGLENAARCRNLKEGTEISESELRSWLEDLSTSADK